MVQIISQFPMDVIYLEARILVKIHICCCRIVEIQQQNLVRKQEKVRNNFSTFIDITNMLGIIKTVSSKLIIGISNLFIIFIYV